MMDQDYEAADAVDALDAVEQTHESADAEQEVEINLPDMSYDNLEKVKEAVVAKQREAREREQAQDLNTVKVLVAKHGFKWSDIKPAKGPSKVTPKYRNPENPEQTWSGRGKPPLWIKDVEDRTPFLIS